jgi:hypothetical protein
MPASPEQLQALNALRSLQGRPPLAAHEIEALTCEEPAPRAGPTALPAPSGEEQQALAYLREVAGPRPAASGIRLPDVGRIVGGVLDRARRLVGASVQVGADDMEEDEALRYLRGLAIPAVPDEHAGPGAPAPAVAAVPAEGYVVDAAALAAAGFPGPVTAKEAGTLAEMAAEYVADGDPPMTSAKATSIVLAWRRRAA